jgi:hypothetical protein
MYGYKVHKVVCVLFHYWRILSTSFVYVVKVILDSILLVNLHNLHICPAKPVLQNSSVASPGHLNSPLLVRSATQRRIAPGHFYRIKPRYEPFLL